MLFGKGTRGLMMGLWNTHQYAGNIVGLSVASAYSDEDWTLSFMYPALIVLSVGLLVFLFLVPKPSHVGLSLDDEVRVSNEALH